MGYMTERTAIPAQPPAKMSLAGGQGRGGRGRGVGASSWSIRSGERRSYRTQHVSLQMSERDTVNSHTHLAEFIS